MPENYDLASKQRPGARPRCWPTARSTWPCPICCPPLDQVLRRTDEPRDDAFPFVLSAGEHRSFTANTIIRAPSWRGTSSHFPELGALGLFVRFQERRQARRNGVPIFAPVERQGDHHSTEVARLRIASHE
jgi:hypothetical protein